MFKFTESNNPPVTTLFVNNINIDATTEQIFELECSLRNTDAILRATEFDKVRLPNAVLKLSDKAELLTSVLNMNAMPKIK